MQEGTSEYQAPVPARQDPAPEPQKPPPETNNSSANAGSAMAAPGVDDTPPTGYVTRKQGGKPPPYNMAVTINQTTVTVYRQGDARASTEKSTR